MQNSGAFRRRHVWGLMERNEEILPPASLENAEDAEEDKKWIKKFKNSFAIFAP
jgi:hypothetical protein